MKYSHQLKKNNNKLVRAATIGIIILFSMHVMYTPPLKYILISPKTPQASLHPPKKKEITTAKGNEDK